MSLEITPFSVTALKKIWVWPTHVTQKTLEAPLPVSHFVCLVILTLSLDSGVSERDCIVEVSIVKWILWKAWECLHWKQRSHLCIRLAFI